MSRNSGGTYSRLTPPGAGGYVAGTVIKPSEVNGELNDFKNEITDSVSRSGKGAALANLPMGGFKHTGAAAGTTGGDYVEFGQYTTALSGKLDNVGPITLTSNIISAGIILRNNFGSGASASTNYLAGQNELGIYTANVDLYNATDGSGVINFGVTPAGSRSSDRRDLTSMQLAGDGTLTVKNKVTTGLINITSSVNTGAIIRNNYGSGALQSFSYFSAQNELGIYNANMHMFNNTDGSSSIDFGVTPAGARNSDRRVQNAVTLFGDGTFNVINKITTAIVQAASAIVRSANAVSGIILRNDYGSAVLNSINFIGSQNEQGIYTSNIDFNTFADGSSATYFGVTTAGARNSDRRNLQAMVLNADASLTVYNKVNTKNTAKGFINFNGTSATINEQFGGLTLTKLATGSYQINIPAGVVSNTYYTIASTINGHLFTNVPIANKTTASFKLNIDDASSTLTDVTEISLTIFGL